MKNSKYLLNPFWNKNNFIKKIFSIFGNENIKFVGGAVRNAIKNNTTNDLDLAVNMEPKKVKKILKKNNIAFYDKSNGHGTVSIKIYSYSVEITSLRKDIITYGRRAKVLFTSSFKLDAKRRDFTINAIYSDLNGELYDPFNGIKHLKINKIEFIGEPSKRINEDKLRVLRYFRMLSLYSTSKKEIDQKSLKSCVEKFYYIKDLPIERINIEFSKLLVAENVSFSLIIMKENNLLDALLEGLQKITNEDIKKIELLPKDVLIRISLLIFKSGINIDIIKNKLKRSNKDITFLQKVCSNSKVIKSEIEAKKLKYFYGEKISKTNYILLNCIFNNKPNPKVLKIFDTWRPPKLPIDGNDLIKLGNIKKNNMKNIIKVIEKWWIREGFKPNKAKCIKKIKKTFFSSMMLMEEET